ncbi:(Fe-S)-binding protein [Oleidesulfovibrio sp.]|uniref:(Fe-S)-binding protein n=1 Tax=Oleidesulfovibrio sp. TaxID=2909707 RepID=UPI003A8C4894
MSTYPDQIKTVYYFGTCLVDMAYPQAGMAGIKLLQKQNVDVIFPSAQSCCGQPAYNSGFPKEAMAVALKQIEAFSKHDYPIIVPSGSCAGMMKLHYPELFANHPDYYEVKKFSNRIFELGDFLLNALNVQYEDKGSSIKVTWHSSCHAKTEMRVTEHAKTLLRQFSNVELVELENEHECCGFGGTFSIKQPELSGAMVQDKIDDILKTGASRVITGDCGCMMNIVGAMEKKNMDIKGQHLAEFIWERIHG